MQTQTNNGVIMDAEEVVKRLKNGEELVNRGCGWFISPPRKPYGPCLSVSVCECIVNKLKAEGKIKIDIPYISAKATLCE